MKLQKMMKLPQMTRLSQMMKLPRPRMLLESVQLDMQITEKLC